MNQDIETDSYIWLKRENVNDEVRIEPELIEAASLEDMYHIYYPSISLYKRILDFIKSWIYYPMLKGYATEQGGWMKESILKTGRLNYAWWHCRKGIYSGWFGRI